MRAKTTVSAASILRVSTVVLFILALLPCAVMAEKAITGINVANKTGYVTVTVQGNSALKMTPLKSTKGAYLGFQFGCKLTEKGRLIGIHAGKIYNVRYSNFSANPPATRVVFNTTGHVEYSTNWSPDKSRVEITVWKNGKPNVKPEVATTTAALNTPAVTAAVTSTTTKPVSKLRTQMPVLVASADPKAIPVPAARPARPIAKVLGDVQEVGSATLNESSEPQKLARVDTTVPQPILSIEKRVSLNFLGADINDVLKALSVQSGRNIVASKDVTGNVTVSLSDVTVDQAMDYVAKLSGYSYAKNDDTYLVAAKDSIRALQSGETDESDSRTVDVFRLYYANIEDIARILNIEYPELTFNIDTKKDAETDKTKKTRGGILLVSGPSDIIQQARVAAMDLDKQVGSLASEVTEIYKVKYVDAAELGEAISGIVPGVMVQFGPGDGFRDNLKTMDAGDLKAADRNSVVAPDYKYFQNQKNPVGENGGNTKDQKTSDRLTKPQTLAFCGSKTDVDKALELAAKLDVKSKLINIEAKITSISKTGEEQLGLKWSWGELSILEDVSAPVIITNDLGADVAISNNVSVNKSLKRWFRQPIDFSATLDALVVNGNANVLASPNLLCVEGKPGSFFVGDDVTYVSSVSASSNGEKTYTTDTKQAGVQLHLVGSVSSEGYITLNLHPEVSTITLSTQGDVVVPTVSRRFTDHVVRVKDGATIAIGGLIRSDEVETMSKIPLLGDLPFLGKLFRHKETANSKNEVVMFITAKIVDD